MEMELLSSAVYWAVLISLGAYLLENFCRKRQNLSYLILFCFRQYLPQYF